MIKYTTGNLLNAKTDALVNTVNTVGVMGKGIALQFKERYKENFRVYHAKAKAKELKVGDILVVKDHDLSGAKLIFNFPTKQHWKGNSKMEYIEAGLEDLKRKIIEYGVKSIALPPLGCGNGGLDWNVVKALIERELKDLPVEILVFEPNASIKAQLEKETRKPEVKKLTPGRAMLLYLMFLYEEKGEPGSVFVANKLAYFLQRSGEKMRLTFQPHLYGPYSAQVQHVLYSLNGKYLSGLEQNQIGPFEPLKLNYEKLEEVRTYVTKELDASQRSRLSSVMSLLSGFESTFSLELLATVDYLLAEKGSKTKEEVMKEIESWSERKTKVFKPHYIDTAMNRLKTHGEAIF
jgi:O-acetyl-ADP-ribose deacetylase (regulator of RNase III)/uncharacterized protein YwgA